MYKIKILIMLFIALYTKALAQIGDTVAFIGNITVDKIDVPYKIKFTIDSNLALIGYSINNIGSQYELKSKIQGNINKDTKEINFKETKILRTKALLLPTDTCYVNATLKFTNKKFGMQLLEGNFIGYDGNNNACATGKLKLVGINKKSTK